MKQSRFDRLDRVRAKTAPNGRVRFIWKNWGESDESVQLRIRARIERGQASEHDEFTVLKWPEPQGGWPPKEPDRWRNTNRHALAQQSSEISPDGRPWPPRPDDFD
jgi:hypothetical protein